MAPSDFSPYNMLSMTLQQIAKFLSLPFTNAGEAERNQRLAAELIGRHFSQTASPSQARRCPFASAAMTAAAAAAATTSNEDSASSPNADLGKALPFSAMPTPKGLPVVGTLFDLIRSGSAPKIHEYCDRRHASLGPIYREKLGSVEAVFVADSQLIRRVFAAEGKFPMHLIPEPWVIYNEKSGNQRGLFFMDGAVWRERRRSLNKVFLRRSAVAEHVDDFSEITADLMSRWSSIRDAGGVLADLEKELYNWSIECLGSFIFGRRMGCVNSGPDRPQADDEIRTFVECVQQIFVESASMTTIPPRLAHALGLPVWRRFEKAVTNALTIARGLVESKVSEIVSKAESGEPVDGMLAQLLLEDNIEEEEIVRIVTDLFLAAADTTSHSTQWALYLLSRHPECQQRLREEIESVVGDGQSFTYHNLASLQYTRAVVKEALRLYPVAPFLTRILTNDLELGGYTIPKGQLVLMSMYTTGRDTKNFDRADEFLPERWIKSSPTHASLPFGMGSRGCIGRRIAEAQMHLFLAQIVQNFSLESANEGEVEISLRMVATPSEPILLKLNDRT